jgi:urease accessory protein
MNSKGNMIGTAPDGGIDGGERAPGYGAQRSAQHAARDAGLRAVAGASSRSGSRLAGVVAVLAGLAVALPAAAHPGHPDSGFTAGLLHPLTGLDHLLALLAVGLWSREQRHGAVLPPVFLVLMALGAACAGAGLALPALETSIAATVLLLGGLVACSPGLQRRLPAQVAAQFAVLVVGGCAFLHGLAHGVELAGAASGAGFLLTSAALMTLGALPGARLRRLAGVAIGAAGLCLLAGVVGA